MSVEVSVKGVLVNFILDSESIIPSNRSKRSLVKSLRMSVVLTIVVSGICVSFSFSLGLSISRPLVEVTSVVSTPSATIVGCGISVSFGLRCCDSSGNHESYDKQDFHG